LWFSSGLLAVYYGPDWPGITALLAGENGYMQKGTAKKQKQINCPLCAACAPKK